MMQVSPVLGGIVKAATLTAASRKGPLRVKKVPIAEVVRVDVF
jgi:hypothetical protein